MRYHLVIETRLSLNTKPGGSQDARDRLTKNENKEGAEHGMECPE